MRARLFDFLLFFSALAVSLSSERINIESSIFIKVLLIYLIFSNLYYHLRIFGKYSNTSFDTGITYGLSFVIFTGPFGLLIFETLYGITVYLNKKRTKTADEGEFLDTFYNIGSYVLSNSIAYLLFQKLYPISQNFYFGFWILMFFLIVVTSFLSASFLVIVLFIMREIKSIKAAFDFILKSRSVLDIATIAITNGLLLLFLQSQKWDMLISLFILNYVVNRSFYSKSQNIQNKTERDKFEQMAYKDFLTGVYNRAYMDKKMTELNRSGEWIGIVVADIDVFKRINDNYNHAVGDRVIQHFATTIHNYINEDDILVRSGGEEFAIFLRQKDFDEIIKLVENIQQSVATSPVNVEYNEENIFVSYTASFGLYFFKADEFVSMEKGYVHADQLLLQSKYLGRNKVSAENEQDKDDSLANQDWCI